MICFSKITEIYCFIDEFREEYEVNVARKYLGNSSKRPSKMSMSEVMTITVLFHLSGFRTFKHFYIY